MKLKKCTKCKVMKERSSFYFADKTRGYHRSACKDCTPKTSEAWEKKTPEQREEHRKRIVRDQRIRADRNIQWLAGYLYEHPCIKCGEKNIVVLEFHHRDPKEKHDGVSVIAGTGKSLEMLQAEVAKCDVMCANCHRIETAHQMNYRILKYIRTASASGSIGGF